MNIWANLWIFITNKILGDFPDSLDDTMLTTEKEHSVYFTER